METEPTGSPEDSGARRWWRRWRERPLTGAIGGDLGLVAVLIAGGAMVFFVLTGGGDSSTASEPSGGGDAGASADSDQALRYAECMRENGVPNFPDPVDGQILVTPESGFDPSSPEYQTAREACQDDAPEGLGGGSGANPEMEEQVLAFAQCMRDNGIDFPDPDFSGGGVRITPGDSDLDPDSPEFEAAQQECSEHLQGLGGGGMRRSAP